jgi:hypothetical protein
MVRRSRVQTREGKVTPELRLTDAQMAQLQALGGRKIDTDDIPEAPAESWAIAQRGLLFRIPKE